MKSPRWLLLAVVVGCDAFPPILPPAENLKTVIGGISDTRPYYGRVKSCENSADTFADVLIASCGCGDWRTLVIPDDGSPPAQFAARYYTEADYVPTGLVTVYGSEEAGTISGMLNQDTGQVSGRIRVFARFTSFDATRGDNHVDSANACAACHTGENPVYPQPPDHPPFQLNPANCLDCHSVN